MIEYKVIGIRSMEYRDLNREVVVYERFDAMREVRRFLAAGFPTVIVVVDDEKIGYTNDVYADYYFSKPLPRTKKSLAVWEPSAIVLGDDVATLWRLNLAHSNHAVQLVEWVVEVEQIGREVQSVPVFLDPAVLRWRLLNGYLQTHDIPVGTTWKCAYPEEMEDWLNAVFRYDVEDRQYFSFKDGVVTVIS
jgi:hypothetical protein